MSDLNIHMESVGTAEPALLFVHGFCCDGSDWQPLIDRLSPHHLCATLDLPGHGRTTGGGCTMAEAGHAVTDAKRRLGVGRVILIGHSLGTKIIREAHRQDPDLIEGLVLVDGSLYVSDRETMLANARAAVSGGMAPFLTGLFGRMFDATTPEATKSFLISRAITRDLDRARALFLDSVDWDTRHARPTIEALTIPALVIQATTFDSEFRWRALQPGESTGLIDAMRAYVRDFEAIVLPDCGHFVMIDQPDLAAKAISRFARRVAARQPVL